MKKPPFTYLCSHCDSAIVYHDTSSFTCPACASTQCMVLDTKDEATLLTTVPHHGVSREHIFPRELVQPQKAALAPPNVAEFMLTMLATTPRAEAMVGDLNERFADECNKFGRDRAGSLYWARTLRSLWPLLRRAIGKALKWGAVLAAVRRLF